jgi:glyoxylase-like metal-dependent hydrolase (beta-lactamase superfamily II)
LWAYISSGCDRKKKPGCSGEGVVLKMKGRGAMQITERVYLVGSGSAGFSLTFHSDCHVYLIDGGGELALIDAGTGPGRPEILDNIRSHGFAPEDVGYLFLTHLHADHAGGSAGLRADMPNLRVLVSEDVAHVLAQGDEKAISLDLGKEVGYYEPDYRFEPCPVDVKLVDGHATPVGDVEIRAIDTPGHCAGHMCFTMEDGGRTTLFSGDNLFSGGKILLQPLPDCDLQAHLRSIEKLVDLGVDVFLPGHGSISLKDGQRHIDEAMSWTKRGLVPPSLL